MFDRCSGWALCSGRGPSKREQILDGAWRMFRQKGFDAASMNDITREAGVSKGTIYVYFSNKEELFEALIDRHRREFADSMRDILAGTEEVREGLRQFGTAFANRLVCTDMIPAMRSLLGVIDRMPKLSRRFFSSAPNNVRIVLEEFIRHHISMAVLRSMMWNWPHVSLSNSPPVPFSNIACSVSLKVRCPTRTGARDIQRHPRLHGRLWNQSRLRPFILLHYCHERRRTLVPTALLTYQRRNFLVINRHYLR